MLRPGLAAAAAVIGWGVLALQFHLSMKLGLRMGLGVTGGFLAYFRYFTILTNILAAVALTAGALVHPSAGGARRRLAAPPSPPASPW